MSKYLKLYSMANLKFFLGQPQEFKRGIYVYSPLLKDITNKEFSTYQSILTISFEEIEDLFQDQIKEDKNFKIPNPYEFLLSNAYNNSEYEQLAKEAFYFFTKKPVTFLYDQKKILIGDIETELSIIKSLDDLIFLEEDEFFDFQNLIREALDIKSIEKPDLNMHPKKRRMLAMRRFRDKVKAKQGKGIKFETMIVSICCMNLGITPLNIGELSYYAAMTLFSMSQDKEKYEMDISSILAGADSKKIHPEYWIRGSDE